MMPASGSLTLGLALAIAGSFHFLTVPRKMPASASGVKFSPAVTPGMVYEGTSAPRTVGKCRTTGSALLLEKCDLFVVHRAVAGPEVDRAFGDLPNAAPRADGLIVDLNVGVQFVVLVEPLRVHGVGKRRPGPVQVLSPAAGHQHGEAEQEWREESSQCFVLPVRRERRMISKFCVLQRRYNDVNMR